MCVKVVTNGEDVNFVTVDYSRAPFVTVSRVLSRPIARVKGCRPINRLIFIREKLIIAMGGVGLHLMAQEKVWEMLNFVVTRMTGTGEPALLQETGGDAAFEPVRDRFRAFGGEERLSLGERAGFGEGQICFSMRRR